MISKEFKECLTDVYHGEIAGEVATDILLANAEDAEQTYILGTLLQFETEGKAIVRPLLTRCGLDLYEDEESRTNGKNLGEQMSALPWTDRFATLHELVSVNYLPRYEELAMLVSAEEDAEAARIAIFMGDHERAFVEVASNIANNRPDPAAPITKLLHFPLPCAGTERLRRDG
ncbi:hypothetical protein [Sphingorhabdus sp. EL138]|uniref:hypothetical protein n=1 Tax=Sphingorhabdus sp. EL138 TaxID=2073156 RepID=UPI000D68FA1C|nr:hypothetical protein [Sphingorhabdus sp. EL138]